MSDLLNVLQSLRSIHGDFADREVTDEDLDRILEASVCAANASNRQSYSIVVLRDGEKMQQLVAYRAPVALIYLADLNRSLDVSRHLGHAFAVRGFPMLISSLVDACLAAQTAAIAAKALGIDSLFTNGLHRGPMARIREILALPEKHVFPVVGLLLGYPATEPSQRRGRLTGPGVIHREAYRRVTPEEADEIVRAHDDPACGLDMERPWRDEGYAHFLDWFYTVWSNRMPAIEGKSQVLQWIEDAGFFEE